LSELVADANLSAGVEALEVVLPDLASVGEVLALGALNLEVEASIVESPQEVKANSCQVTALG